MRLCVVVVGVVVVVAVVVELTDVVVDESVVVVDAHTTSDIFVPADWTNSSSAH